MIESHEEKSCRLFDQAIYIYLISCRVKSSFQIELSSQASQLNSSAWVQLLNSTRHFFKKIPTQLNTFQVEYLTWTRILNLTRSVYTLLNVITNARLKLLLKSDIITREAHNQFTMIDLVFNSEKIQFMTRKCKIQINLHQKLNHLSIITKLCLQTISMQLSTWWLWKKKNTEALSAYLQIHLSLKHSLDDKTMMNDRVCKIIRVLQKIIEKFILLTKSSN